MNSGIDKLFFPKVGWVCTHLPQKGISISIRRLAALSNIISMQLKALSYQIADSIDLKAFKTAFPVEVYAFDNDELFYSIEEHKCIYVFKYGVVCFLNYDEIKIAEFIQFISPYCKNIFSNKLFEELVIETDAKEFKFGYNKVEIQSAEVEVLRLIMLNVSQSVALD